MKITLLSLALSALMFGCGSSSTSSHYYLLNKPPILQPELQTELQSETIMPVSKSKQSTKNVFFVQVQLAEYLNQPYIVMQLKTHKIHYSSFNLWAEPLLMGVKKSLLLDLNTLSHESDFFSDELNKASEHLANLTVKIDFFHITNDSTVILSGQYYWQKPEQLGITSPQPFLFHQQLQADGYDHAVTQQRDLLTQLAQSIIVKLRL